MQYQRRRWDSERLHCATSAFVVVVLSPFSLTRLAIFMLALLCAAAGANECLHSCREARLCFAQQQQASERVESGTEANGPKQQARTRLL